MRKKVKIIIVVMVFCVFGVTGCASGISQEEYANLAKEKEELVEELDKLTEAYEDIHKQYEELMAEKAERVKKEMEFSTPRAWAATYFGEHCLVFTDGSKYLQIVADGNYEVSLNGVQEAYDCVLSSMPGLEAFKDSMSYEKIGIKFNQTSGAEMVEFVFIRNNGTYTLESINGNLLDAETLSAALMLLSE